MIDSAKGINKMNMIYAACIPWVSLALNYIYFNNKAYNYYCYYISSMLVVLFYIFLQILPLFC